ncbi:hypothetical protein SLA2020_137510 [Shorea laevis]
MDHHHSADVSRNTKRVLQPSTPANMTRGMHPCDSFNCQVDVAPRSAAKSKPIPSGPQPSTPFLVVHGKKFICVSMLCHSGVVV